MIGSIAVAVALLSAGHQVGLSRGVYAARARAVDVELTLARGDLAAIVPPLAPALDAAAERSPLPVADVQALVPLIDARAGDAPCAVTVTGADAVERDGASIALRIACAGDGALTITHAWLDKAPGAHRHLARVTDTDGERDALLLAGSATLALKDTPPPSRAAFVIIGVEHILLGPDHLVFLVALVVVGVRRRPRRDEPDTDEATATRAGVRELVALVMAFTLSHSVTLALAVFDLVVPPGAVIEPLIALSIVVVGIENLFTHDVRGRWRFAGAFGLVHGFGFAGALGDVGLPADDVPVRLLAFNVGVELGQLAFLLVLVPPLELLRRRGLIGRRFVVGASIAVCAAGLAWFVERVFL